MYSAEEIIALEEQELLLILSAYKVGRKTFIPLNSLDIRFYAPPTNFSLPVIPCKESKRISKGEKECKRVLEEYFQEPFYRVRPKALEGLELDCFNPRLGIACEYHGKQHYVFPSRYVKRKKEFLARLKRDLYKLALSRKIGLLLIVVPYTIKIRDIKRFILQHLTFALS